MDGDIGTLRDRIAELDRALLELLGERFRLAARVGELKAEAGRPVVVREVEQRVLGRARDAAELCGVSPEVMEGIFGAIIRGSVERQHRVGVARKARGGERVLVLGAGGAMGGWLRRFLEGMGHSVAGVDPAWAALPQAEDRWGSLEAVPDLDAFDAIVVSAALDAMPAALEALAERRPRGTVLEIASIKSDLEGAFRRLREAGVEALSIHPMFGPSKNPYEPLTVVHATWEDEAAERARVLELLQHPYLDLVSLPFALHDRLMGWLLGLSHLTGMLFAVALERSGLDPAILARIASTSFKRQSATSRSVLDNDPDLYFTIQRLNPHRGEVYAALHTAIGELTAAVERADRERFREILAAAAGMLPPGEGVRE